MIPLFLFGFSWSTAIATLASLLVVSFVFKFTHNIKAVGFLPGLRVPFQPLSIIGIVLPEAWWNPGLAFTWTWRKRKNIYRRYGCDTVSIVPFISGFPTIYTRSLEVGKQVAVAGHKSGAFGKADWMFRFFLFWGSSVVSAEGEVWKRHRKIVNPAFNNNTYAFVWNASHKLYAEMISAEGWTKGDVVDIPNMQTLTAKFTFIIFLSVGFGFPFTWIEQPVHEGEMSIQECMKIIVETNTLATSAPAWVWKLPLAWVKRTSRAYDTMRSCLYTLVTSMRETIQYEADDTASTRARDLLSVLVRASEDAKDKMGLNDDELIGNVFAFMFAETTAASLAATLAFLALNRDLQDELVAEVHDVTRSRDDNTLFPEDYDKLDKVLAVFYEGIRMFPSGFCILREAKQDTVLNISDGSEPRMLPVKKGTHVVVDLIGIQYNPRHFSEPEEFQASRWYKKQKDLEDEDESEESDNFTAFGIGPRACLGRKFATTEGVCLLASLLRDWRVEPLLATWPDGHVESLDEWQERVVQANIKVVMGISDLPLRFVRRT